MSTFKGIIAEFPRIRIDYFRHQPQYEPPLACFLSHIHSDHLTGLESLRAPFVYCSAATREILLRLEKYYHRLNFARGILESRNVTYEKSMHRLAKPLPLETPTIIELSPSNKIRVTLFDANHCVGATMFLIEGGGKAILYTGDIRAETWWVNSIVQNPVLLPYTLGPHRLDCVYLDTTFATKSSPYREFPSKADGIRELLGQVAKCQEGAIFYFHSWTFGYENVWIALSAFLKSRIHLDEYRFKLYESLSTLKNKALQDACLGFDIREAPALCGFKSGNRTEPGCLTSEHSNVQIHSCERGMGCPVVDHDPDARIVHIIPIVTRANGTEIAELGAGGGKGDLDQKEELETGDVGDVDQLMELCATKIQNEQVLERVLAVLQQARQSSNGKIDLGVDMHKESQDSEDDLSLQALVSILSSHAQRAVDGNEQKNQTIRFPYSRHSSYSELCSLVQAFRPNDIYPCVVDEENWSPPLSMHNLFGEYCSKKVFRHDQEMMEIYEAKMAREHRRKREDGSSQNETQTTSDGNSPIKPKRPRVEPPAESETLEEDVEFVTPAESLQQSAMQPPETGVTPKLSTIGGSLAAASTYLDQQLDTPNDMLTNGTIDEPSTISSASGKQQQYRPRLRNRELAYKAAIGFGLTWSDYGGLVSARRDTQEEEL